MFWGDFMKYFLPDIYKKNIYNINYQKLKSDGIKCLIFDLDNTLGLISNKECPTETKKLLDELKKDFIIYISSNNTRKRLRPYLNMLCIEGVSWSMKPLTVGLRRINKKSRVKKNEMCIIGDQMVTDVFAGKRYGIKTILVDPLGKKDMKITSLNRFIEKIIIKNYQKSSLFERGRYYG